MLSIKCFVVNGIQENCYVINDESREAVIIDCGAQTLEEWNLIEEYISRQQLRPIHLLNTHAHFDHIWGVNFVYETYGLKPEMHPDDIFLYENVADQFRAILHRDIPLLLPPNGPILTEGESIDFGTHHLSVITTPGHTPGGICFFCQEESVLFTGDTIFRQAIGRTDLPYGNSSSLQHSILQKILTLPKQTVLYPGHGEPTTIGAEQAYYGVEYLS
ncbi:MAG: MBL fold metallo-hydrolase [Alloprevotella sp.]|nr:MBL fold metallo-hydrolase [Alloprevotella sp.]